MTKSLYAVVTVFSYTLLNLLPGAAIAQGPVFSGVPANVTVQCNAVPATANVTATGTCIPNAMPVVWINEFHYDNSGTDQGEFIEIAGTAGTNLAGYSLLLYNGANQVYTTTPLSGVIPDQQNGFGTLAFAYPQDGIQNGPSDGIALVQGGTVIQALAYEGSFTATTGTATGVLFADIGVSETGSTPVGFSLRLAGTGNQYSNFTWQAPAAATPGAVNQGQTLANPAYPVAVTLSETTTPGSCPNNYTITRTWTATDQCGVTATATQTITVVDTGAPVLAGVPANVTVQCDAVPAPASVTATDNCTTTVTVDFAENTTPGACPNAYTIVRIWTASDECGNTASASQTITVVDTQAPVLAGVPANTTAACDDVPGPAFPTATDNCAAEPVVTLATTTIPGSCPGNYVLVHTYTATDACGNSATASYTITVSDTEAPVLDGVLSSGLAPCESVPPAPAITATDNCAPNPIVTVTATTIPGSCPNNYTLVRTYVANDGCGNTATASYALTVVDPQAPMLVGVPADVTVQCNAVPPQANVTATDNCTANPTVTLTTMTNAGSCPNNYTLVRVWTATDDCGNSASAAQTITVVDTQAPVLAGVPADTDVDCQAIPPPATVTATDNCTTNPTVTLTSTTSGDACYYVITRTWTATDQCGNTATASQRIYVSDTYEPVFTFVPPNMNQACGTTATFGTPTYGDNCTPTPNIGLAVTTTANPGANCAGGTVTRVWTITDQCGRTATASQTITFTDTQAPVLTGVPANVTLQCNQTIPPPANVTASDNCTANVTVVLNSTTTQGSCPQNSTIVRTWSATDACGNTATASQTITIVDTQAPVLAGVPANVTVQCNAVPPPATVTATDNCAGGGGPTTAVWINEFHYDNTGADVGEFVEIAGTAGTNLSGYSLVFYNGAIPTSATTYATINLSGTLPNQQNGFGVLSFAGPAGGIQNGNNDGIALVQGTTVIQLLSYEGPFTASNGPAAGMTATDIGVFEAGTEAAGLSVQLTGTGNTYNAFTWTGPATASPGALNAGQTFTAAAGGGGVVVTLSTNTIPGSCANNYTLIRTWTANDGCGNTATASQTLTVIDTQAPTFTSVPASTTQACGTTPNFGTPVASDNCTAAGGITITSVTTTNPNAGCAGSTTRTWTANDGCGNTATASQTITFTDTQAPVLAGVPANVTVQCNAVPPPANVTATDNCAANPTVTLNTTTTPGACPENYTLVRTWTATDACGNTATASQSVTVVDTQAPVLAGVPANVTVQCAAQVPPPANVTANDNCAGGTVAQLWINEFHYDNASADQGEFIEIAGTAGLDLSGYSLVLYNGSNAAAAVTYSTVALSGIIPNQQNGFGAVSFAYPVDGIQNGNNDGIALVQGTTVIQLLSYEGTFTASNGPAAGMTSVDVGVLENGTNAVGTSLQLTGTGNQYVNFAWTGPAAASPGTLNTGQTLNAAAAGVPVTFSQTTTPGACPSNFTVARTWTASDNCGNTASATQTITVNDTQAPVLSGVPANITVQCNAVPPPANVTASDNCAANVTVTLTTTITPGACVNSYTLVRTWTATDGCNTATASQTVNVIDTQAPVLAGVPANVTVQCNAVPPPAMPTATDNCSGSGAAMIVWINEFHYDNSGTDAGEFIEVAGLAGTNLAAYSLVLYNGANGQPYSTTVLSGILPNEQNGVGIAAFSYPVNGLENGSPDGIALVQGGNVIQFLSYEGTFTATGGPAAGMMSTDVGVLENGSNAVGTSLQLGGSGNTYANFAWTGPAAASPGALNAGQTITAASAGVTITFNQTSTPGACANAYTLVRTWTATDECGNATTATQTVNVIDTQAPVLAGVPANVTVQCNAVPPAATVTATDNCTANVAVTLTTTTTPGACPNAYILVRTWSATDGCGNTATATQTVNVVDTQAPVLAGVPANVTVQCNAVPPAATVTATDNCTANVAVTLTTTTTPGACPSAYTLVRTWTATDGCGNTATVTQTVTVIDTQAPTFTVVPPAQTLECVVGLTTQAQVQAYLGTLNAQAIDNCGTPTVAANIGSFVPGCGVTGTYNVVFTATDLCGNTATATTTITITDTQAPQFTVAPSSVFVQCNTATNVQDLQNWLAAYGGATAEDCGDVTLSHNYDPANVQQTGCGASFAVQVTFTATDACGNSTVRAATFTAWDQTPPVFTVPAQDLVIECDSTSNDPAFTLQAWLDAQGNAVVTEDCGEFTLTILPLGEQAGPNGTTVRRYRFIATNDCGLQSSDTASVYLADTTPPTIVSCPPNGTATFSCVEDVPQPDLAAVVAADNCGDVTVTLSRTETVGVGCSWYPQTIIYHYAATDAAGNVAYCQQGFEVVDQVAPVEYMPDTVFVACVNDIPTPGVISAVARPYVQENCPDSLRPLLIDDTGLLLGTTRTFTLSAKDYCGNVTVWNVTYIATGSCNALCTAPVDVWGNFGATVGSTSVAAIADQFFGQSNSLRAGLPGQLFAVTDPDCLDDLLPATGTSTAVLPAGDYIATTGNCAPIGLPVLDASGALANELVANSFALQLSIWYNRQYNQRDLAVQDLTTLPGCLIDEYVMARLNLDTRVHDLLMLVNSYLGGALAYPPDFGDRLNESLENLLNYWNGCQINNPCNAVVSPNAFRPAGGNPVADRTDDPLTGLLLAPNPATTATILRFTATIDLPVTIRLRSASGADVLVQYAAVAGENRVTLPLAGLPTGLYWVTVAAGDRVQTLKLVLETGGR